MDFALPESVRELQQVARSFAETECAPLSARMDRTETFETALLPKMAERGLLDITIPKAYGGQGLGNLHACVVLEEVNRVDASVGVTISVHLSLACAPIISHGTEAQKQTFLPRMARGEWIGCYALTEPVSGSDAASLVSRATRDGVTYTISGTKSWISSASYAHVLILMARTAEHKTRGITAFVVPMDTPGVVVSKAEEKLGLRGSKTHEIVLDNARVPSDLVLGEEGIGFKIALSMLDGGRIGIAAQAVGIGRACLEAATEYVHHFHSMEKGHRLGPVLDHKLAQMKAQIDAARLLTYRAACLRDTGQPCTMEAAQAKLFASQVANACADEAMQIFGVDGYTEDQPLSRYFRDARITEIYEGTSEIQKLVLARNVLAQHASVVEQIAENGQTP